METLPLKDIHLPEPITWWPPAPGWWLLVVLSLLACYAIFLVFKQFKKQNAFKTAGKMLLAIKHQQHEDPVQTLVAVSALLRRVAISIDARSEVASLSGQAWLSYLDKTFKDAPFSNGVGRCLADAQYRPVVAEDTDFDELFKLCERWLKQQKASKFSLWANLRGKS